MLFFILSVVVANRTLSPIKKYLYEQIPLTKYTQTIDSTLLLQYNSFPGVYSMELSEMIDGEAIPMLPNKTLDPYTLNGCYPYERRLIYKHLLDDQVPQDDQFFTNMYIENNVVYVTRSDNSILTYEILINDKDRTVKDINLQSIHNMNGSSSEHFIGCYNSICAIFTSQISFIYNQSNFTIIQLNQQPTNVYFDESTKIFYLTYNNNIIDVFTFTNKGELIQTTQITAGEKISQVRSNVEGTKLYILDKVQGILIYKIISLNEYQDTNFKISIQNGQAFDFYKNTFFVVAETYDNVPYALEIFLQENSYYFNKVYSKDMDIFDVWVGEHFAILIGSDVHRVIYHSIFNKFSKELEQPLFFQDIDLVNVEELRMWNSSLYNVGAFEIEPFSKAQFQYKQSFMVGISNNQLSVFSIKSVSPWIQCKPKDTNITQYYLKMNSTNCQSKQVENDFTAFKQCVIMHNFTIEGKQILFYEEDGNKIILIGCGLISLILFLIIGVILSRKHFDNELEKLKLHVKFDDQELQTIPDANVII